LGGGGGVCFGGGGGGGGGVFWGGFWLSRLSKRRRAGGNNSPLLGGGKKSYLRCLPGSSDAGRSKGIEGHSSRSHSSRKRGEGRVLLRTISFHSPNNLEKGAYRHEASCFSREALPKGGNFTPKRVRAQGKRGKILPSGRRKGKEQSTRRKKGKESRTHRFFRGKNSRGDADQKKRGGFFVLKGLTTVREGGRGELLILWKNSWNRTCDMVQ